MKPRQTETHTPLIEEIMIMAFRLIYKNHIAATRPFAEVASIVFSILNRVIQRRRGFGRTTNHRCDLAEIPESHEGLAFERKVVSHDIPQELIHASHTTFLTMGISSHMIKFACRRIFPILFKM